MQVESDERVIAPDAVDDFLIGSSADAEILNVFRGVASAVSTVASLGDTASSRRSLIPTLR